MLHQRVAGAEPVENLEALPVQTGFGGHTFEERRVQLEVQAVGCLLPQRHRVGTPAGNTATSPRTTRASRRRPPCTLSPTSTGGPRWTMTAWAVKGGTSISPEVCLKRSTLTPRQPLPSLEETVSTGATWEKSSTGAGALRAPSVGVTRLPSRSSAKTRFAFYIQDGSRKSDLLFGGIETNS